MLLLVFDLTEGDIYFASLLMDPVVIVLKIRHWSFLPLNISRRIKQLLDLCRFHFLQFVKRLDVAVIPITDPLYGSGTDVIAALNDTE